MNCNLFTAWYCLGVLALVLAAYLVALPFIGASRAMGGFGFLGLLGFLPFFWFVIFRKEKLDERDMLFVQRSLFFGFCIGFSVMGPIIALLALTHHGASSISINLIGLPLNIGAFVGVFASSVMLLHSYYKGGHTEHGVQNVP